MSSPLTSVLGGTPTEAPGQQAPETPQLATEQAPLDLNTFLAERGLEPAQAAELIERARQLDSPEGQQALWGQLQEQNAGQLNSMRMQIMGEELGQLLSDEHGRNTLQNALAASYKKAGQPIPWEAQGGHQAEPGFEEDASAKAIRSLVNEVKELKAGMQQFGQMSAQQQQQNRYQQQIAGQQQEYFGWLRSNPNAAPVQQELASDLWSMIKTNPQAFQSQGAVARAASHLLSRYRGIANRFGQKPKAPLSGPRPGGGGTGVVPAMPEPASDDDAVAMILAEMDNINGGR